MQGAKLNKKSLDKENIRSTDYRSLLLGVNGSDDQMGPETAAAAPTPSSSPAETPPVDRRCVPGKDPSRIASGASPLSSPGASAFDRAERLRNGRRLCPAAPDSSARRVAR